MSKIALMLAMVLSVSWGGPVCAAEFPTKEIQIIVPWAAGGATDLIFRAMGATAAKYLGKAVVVVNRPGGGGAVGFTDAMKARPDGYTLVTAVTPLCILPHQTATAFTYRDFDPILNVVSDPSMFLVQADAPWKTTAEFVDYARKNPDAITVGNSGAGGGVHLVALAFEKAAGIKLNHIPFSGGGPSVTALMGGHVNAVSVSPPEGVAQIRAGQLRIVALFAEKRLAMFPDVPTVKEQGIDFTMGMWRGLAAPKGTPTEIIQKLHDAFKKTMDDSEFQNRAREMSVLLSYLGPKDFGALMAKDDEFLGKLIKSMKP